MNAHSGFIYFYFLALSWCIALFGSPEVTQIDIAAGPSSGKTVLQIKGSGFTGVSAVNFGTTPAASFNFISDSSITATSPPHFPQAVPITVTTSEGISPIAPESFYVYQGDWNLYVANTGDNTVSIIDTSSYAVIKTPHVGSYPGSIAFTPDGSSVYVANNDSDTVSVIDNMTFSTSTIKVGNCPSGIAITPDGTKAFVSNYLDGSVSIIDTAQKSVIAEVVVGSNPASIAITPDGKHAYIANILDNSISVIDTASHEIKTIEINTNPFSLAITPNGKFAYASTYNGIISVLDIANAAIATKIPTESKLNGITITPNGKKAYLASLFSNKVFAIDTKSNRFMPIIVGKDPLSLSVSSNGNWVYVINSASSSVSVIDTSNDLVIGTIKLEGTNPPEPLGIAITPDSRTAFVNDIANHLISAIRVENDQIFKIIAVGDTPWNIAMSPDQAPLARFSFKAAPVGHVCKFDASSSASPSGKIDQYFWDFGDGKTAQSSEAIIEHTYAKEGDYSVSLTVTNSAGTSTKQRLTPASVLIQSPLKANMYSASNAAITHNGGPTAESKQKITISAM